MRPSEPSAVSSESLDIRHVQISSHAKTLAVLRVLKGESVESLSQELGVSVRRIERWKNSFVAAGSAELGKRTDQAGWLEKHAVSIRQWLWLVIALVAVVTVLVLVSSH
jgi:hypothetical protein